MLVALKRQDLQWLYRIAPRGRFVLDASESDVVLYVHTPEFVLSVPVRAHVAQTGGSVLLPDLQEFVREVKEEFITIQADESNMQCTAKDRCVYCPVHEVHVELPVEPRRYIEIDGEKFSKGLRFAMIASERKQTAHLQYDLEGVCFDFEVGALVGLSGPCMAVAYIDGDCTGTLTCPRVVMPAKVCKTFLKVHQFAHERLKVWYGLNEYNAPVVYIQAGRAWMSFEGNVKFPSYWRSFIPVNAPVCFKTLARDVLQALNQLPVEPADSPSVTVAGGDGQLQFSRGNVVEVLPIDQTEQFEVVFDVNHLRDLFRAVPPHKTMVWSIQGRLKPAQICDDTEQFLYVVMPRRE
jgi:hypothetical protein